MEKKDRDNSDMLRIIFDAMPSMVFIVDNDVRIHEYNAAAAEVLSDANGTIIKQRCGDVIKCLHSTEVLEDADIHLHVIVVLSEIL